MSPAQCPFCSSSISVLTVAKAPLPNLLHCQTCGQKVWLDRMLRFVVWYLAIGFVLAVLLAAGIVADILNGLSILIAAVGLLVIYELVVSLLVVRFGTFTKPPQ